jgi:hypothetical protein
MLPQDCVRAAPDTRPTAQTTDQRPHDRQHATTTAKRPLNHPIAPPTPKPPVGSVDPGSGEATGYTIRERTLRALYADDVGMKLAHPFPGEFASDMHLRIVEFMEPATTFVHQVEAAWLHTRRDIVVMRRPGREPQTLRESLEP